jgi:pyruvate kinase
VRRAKIVCTLGPAVSSETQIRALVDAGMDVARLNLSHGEYADHEQVYLRVRKASDETGRGVAVLVDLQGPKIRVGTFASGPVQLADGAEFTITTEDVPGDEHVVGTTYDGLPGDVKPGDRLLIDDGKVALECVRVDGPRVVTKVVEGGRVSNNKGINLPGVAVSVPALSEKDKEDLRWALHLQADLIALSFVRSADDVKDVRAIMEEEGIRLPVLAKIEKPEAVDNLAEIVEAFDGIMVARGDLGVELPLEDVPLVQTQAITLARRAAKPVIVATQMLESMIETSRPTRAEASDVANAVLDGTDAVMLSGETSVGKYPVLTVSTMARIVATTEGGSIPVPRLQHDPRTHGGALTVAASQIARNIGAKALVAFSQTGDTVRRLSRLHCELPLYAFTPVAEVRDQLALSWGVETFLTDFVQHTDDMFRQVDAKMLGLGLAKPGDFVVVVAGSPPNAPGSTNTLRVHQLGSLVDPATV